MAIVEGQKVTIKWNNANRKWYEGKGYIFTKNREEFEVNIEDLTKGSNFNILVKCDNCGEIHLKRFATANNETNTHYCKKCNNRKVTIECETCGNLFEISKGELGRRKTCSNKCHPTRQPNKIECKCSTCGKALFKTKSQIEKSVSGNVFCNNDCVAVYNSETKKNKKTKTCLICEKEYEVIPARFEKSVTCSVECQVKWQSEVLVGENANNYNKAVTKEDRTVSCEWCSEEFQVKSPYKLKNQEHHLCSKECYREWFAKFWSQQEEWKEVSRIRAVEILEKGLISKINSGCQNKINEILTKNNINYVNEKGFKYVSIDNFLTDYNLAIEVMGTYWHCDPRVYGTILYQMQLDRIIHDKRKRSLLNNKHGIDILYLWESDIENNIDLCEKLILHYIEKSGKIVNYHSFNYYLNSQSLHIKDEVTLSYFEREIDYLNSIFVPSDGVKKSKKQQDKWIKFNCDECGEESEQLIGKYNDKKNHFCSRKCAYAYAKGKPRKKK